MVTRSKAVLGEVAVYLGTLALCALYIAVSVSLRDIVPEPGELVGNDSFMRLLRVTQLYETGAWYDNTIVRNNAPYGSDLHWTRPFDLLLLAGALVLEPFVGFEQGLYLWSFWSSVVLYVALVLAFVWSTKPLYDSFLSRLILILVIFFQPAFIGLARFARPDHHTLIVITAVVVVGLVLRLLQAPQGKRIGWPLGLALGFGLWLSTEMLIVVGPVLAALALLWLYRGRDFARPNFDMGCGFLVMAVVAFLLEVPAAEWFVGVYDKISIVHLLIAFVVLAFWSAVSCLETRTAGGLDGKGRFIASALGGGASITFVYVLYPDFFAGPQMYSDPFVGEMYMERIGELQPLWPTNWQSFLKFVSRFGPALIVVPFLIYRLAVLDRRRNEQWNSWFFVLLCLVIFIPFGLESNRFLVYSAIFMVIGLPSFVVFTVDGLERVSILPLRALARALTAGLCIWGFLLLSHNLRNFTTLQENNRAQSGSGCDLSAAIEALRAEGDSRAEPLIVLSSPDYGPRILYFSEHAVVGSPYHRNEAGMLDSLLVLLAKTDGDAKQIVDQRGVDVILVCKADRRIFDAGEEQPYFFERLLDDDYPHWLSPMGQETSNYKLYRVRS